MSIGGVTNVQETSSSEKFCKCLGIAENGILGMLTLKSSLTLFAVVDIFLGAFCLLFLFQEVIWEWEYFNANGPHYFLTLFYYLRVVHLPLGVIGFIGVQ